MGLQEFREKNRENVRRSLRRWEVGALALAIFYAGAMLLSAGSVRWLLALFSTIMIMCALGLEWVRSAVDRMNDMRFDWWYQNARWVSLWRGWTKRPWK